MSLESTAVIVTAPAVLGAGAWAAEHRASASLDASMAAPALALLPGARVEHAEVTDDPGVLAVRSDRVQQTVVEATSVDDHPVTVFVREYDADSERAESVSWQLRGLPLAPGWAPVTDSGGAFLDVAEAQVDGHHVRVTAAARVEGDRVVVTADSLTVDGAVVALADAPAAVREALAPVEVRVPRPDSSNTVRSVWFDGGGVAVELHARDVDAGGDSHG